MGNNGLGVGSYKDCLKSENTERWTNNFFGRGGVFVGRGTIKNNTSFVLIVDSIGQASYFNCAVNRYRSLIYLKTQLPMPPETMAVT